MKKGLLVFILIFLCSCQASSTIYVPVVKAAPKSGVLLPVIVGAAVAVYVYEDYQKPDSERLREGKCPFFETIFGDCNPHTGKSYGFPKCPWPWE